MRMLGIALGVLIGILGGVWAGLALGSRARVKPKLYWALAVGAFLACMAANYAGLTTRQPWLSYGAIAAMGGLLTGTKYGYSESIKVWRPIEQVTDAATQESQHVPDTDPEV